MNPTHPPASPLDPRGLPVGYPFKPDWEITPRDTRKAIAAGASGLILLDIRRPDEVDRSRIAGSVHIPMDQIEKRLDELENEAGARTRPIIVHCHHGARSMKITAALRAHGFTDVRSMAGGIDLWSIAVDGQVPRY